MGSQQAKQGQEGQNFSDYYLTETGPSEREMQYIEKLAAKLNQSAEEIQFIQTFLEQRGYKFSNRLLGKGGTSIVLRAENILNQKIALKILKCTSKEEYLNNLQEYRLMKQASSDHVIKVLELLEYRSNNKLIQFLAMERCLYNLQSQISGGKKMTKIQIYEICLQLSKGLSTLHQQNILHLDIKPGNIVLGFDNKWKFIDMGLSKLLPQNQAYSDDIQGLTKYYCSPEQYQLFYDMSKNKIGRQSDIYSLGLVFLELTGKRLNEEQIEESKIKRINFDQFFNPDFEDLNKLISKMLQYNPDHRCNLTQIKNYLYQQFTDEGSTTTTTGGSNSPINLLQYQVGNNPMLKRTERSRSHVKVDHTAETLDLRRQEKQKSMHDLSSLENISSLSPKKSQFSQRQDQAQQIQGSFSNVFQLRRSGSQHTIVQDIPNIEGMTPKKMLYPQKLDQIQQVRNMLQKKLSVADFLSPTNQLSKDISPSKPRSKIILPSLSKVPSSTQISPNRTYHKGFLQQNMQNAQNN